MTNKLFIALGTLAILGITPTRAFAAPKLYFEPTNITVKKDQEFTVPIKIDVESNQVIASDITISFANDDQTLVGVDNANYFPEFTWASNGSNLIEVHAFSSSIHQTKTGSGIIANLKFRAKKDSGSSATTFSCTNEGSDTNIISNNGSNILSCNSLNQTLISYGSITNSPSPSPSPSNTNSDTNNSNTRSPVCTSLKLDPSTSSHIPQSVALLCAGSDADSDITSAYFDFGDGTSQTITKNIGRDSSFSTSHSYTKAGTYKVTCKLKDGNSTSNECGSTLSLTSSVKPTPTPKATIKPSPTLKGKVLSLVDENEISPSPNPSLIPLTSPELQDSDTTETSSTLLWWIFGIVILSGIGIFIFVRILKSSSTPIPPAEL